MFETKDFLSRDVRVKALQALGGKPLPFKNFDGLINDPKFNGVYMLPDFIEYETPDLTEAFFSYIVQDPEILEDPYTNESPDHLINARYRLHVVIAKLWDNDDATPTSRDIDEFYQHSTYLKMDEPDLMYLDFLSFHLNLRFIRSLSKDHHMWVKQQEIRLFILRLVWADLQSTKDLTTKELCFCTNSIIDGFLESLNKHFYEKCVVEFFPLENIVNGKNESFESLLSLRKEIRKANWKPTSTSTSTSTLFNQPFLFHLSIVKTSSVLNNTPLLFQQPATSNSTLPVVSYLPPPPITHVNQLFTDPKVRSRIPPCILNVAMQKRKDCGFHMKNSSRFPVASSLAAIGVREPTLIAFMIAHDNQCNQAKVINEASSAFKKKLEYSCGSFAKVGLCPFTSSFNHGGVKDIEDIVIEHINSSSGESSNQINYIVKEVKDAMMTSGNQVACATLCNATKKKEQQSMSRITRPSEFYFQK